MKDLKKHEARLLDSFAVNAETSLLTFVIEKSYDPKSSESEAPSFRPHGGQYVILDTGALTPDGKPLKRAYSMLPVQVAFERVRVLGLPEAERPGDLMGLAVFNLGAHSAPPRRSTVGSDHDPHSLSLDQGHGSLTMIQAKPGQVFKLSGPWGRLTHEHEGEWIHLDQEAKGEDSPSPAPGDKTSGALGALEGSRIHGISHRPQHRLLMVVAAGTGITGGLNLFAQSASSEVYAGSHLLWIDDGRFLPQGIVGDLLSSAGAKMTVLGPDDLGSFEVTLAQLLAQLTGVESPSQGVIPKRDIVLDAVFFGDGSFFKPMMDQLEGFLKESRRLEKKPSFPLRIQVKKEFYYNRPTVTEGSDQKPRQGGAGESRGAPGNL